MPQQTLAETLVAAPPGRVLDVIGDIDAYPTWARGVQEAQVLAEDDLGWPLRARFTVTSNALSDTHVLAYAWDVAEDGTGIVSWTLESSGALRALQGSYTLTGASPSGGAGAVGGPDGAGEATRVEYRLAVELRLAVPAMLRRRAETSIVTAALDSLRARVDALAASDPRFDPRFDPGSGAP